MPHLDRLLHSLALNVLVPLAVVQALLRTGHPPLVSLSAAAGLPLIGLVSGSIRSKRIDLIGGVSLAALVIGLLLTAFTGNIFFALVKESVVTTLMAGAFLVSLVVGRPLIYVFGREYGTGGDPSIVAEWDARWETDGGFGRTLRVMTAAWGVGLLLAALGRILIALSTPPVLATIVSPAIELGISAALIVWTVVYAKWTGVLSSQGTLSFDRA